MQGERLVLRAGTVMIIGAIVLRLLNLGGGLVQILRSPETTAVMLFLGTGRIVHPQQTESIPVPEETVPVETEPVETKAPETEESVSPEPEKAVFSQQDALLVELNNVSGYSVDIPALLGAPREWGLIGQEPTVLILHTHTSESYEKTEDYVEDTAYRTLDSRYNMVSVGDRLAELLSRGGIRVLHDRSLHDYPSYNGSYTHARQTIQEYLQQYPSIRLVLDLHRDAITDKQGNQKGYTVDVSGVPTAQLMLVMGTNWAGLEHPNWQENLTLAVQLHAQLERICPGICRPLGLRAQRFNQDMSPGAILIEVGAAGNTRQEALAAMVPLAEGILALANGTAGYEDT